MHGRSPLRDEAADNNPAVRRTRTVPRPRKQSARFSHASGIHSLPPPPQKRYDAKTGTMAATGNGEPFAGGANAAMPHEYRTSYRARYEDEPARLKERLADAAQADAPSILAEALKEEYAAAERAGLRDKPESENFLEPPPPSRHPRQ